MGDSMENKQLLWQKEVLKEDVELTASLKQMFNKTPPIIISPHLLPKKQKRIKR